MPAFGPNGIVNLNPTSPKITYTLVKDDGSIVTSSTDKTQIEAQKETLSKQLNSELHIVENETRLI